MLNLVTRVIIYNAPNAGITSDLIEGLDKYQLSELHESIRHAIERHRKESEDTTLSCRTRSRHESYANQLERIARMVTFARVS